MADGGQFLSFSGAGGGLAGIGLWCKTQNLPDGYAPQDVPGGTPLSNSQ